MTVYADVIFAMNTVVNYLLLLLGSRLTGFPARPWRALLGAALGGVYAVCVLLPALAFFGSIAGKILCFCLMAAVAYGFRSKAIRPGAAALLCGGALAGFIFLLTQVFSLGIVAFRGHLYYPLAARALILMAGIFYLGAALLVAGSLKHRAAETRVLQLRLGSRSIRVSALYDTGNTLNDPISGKPVVVLERDRGAELMGIRREDLHLSDPAGVVENLNRLSPGCKCRLLPYRAVGLECGMLPAIPCRAQLGKGREIPVLAAISPTPVSDGGGYEALIGGGVL